MDESQQQIMETKASRPALIWVITIFYLISIVFTALSFVLVYSGRIPVNPGTQQYLASLTVFDHVMTGIIVGRNLIATILLFMLRKQAFHLFAAAFTITILSTVYQSVAKGWTQALGGSGVISALIGYGISFSIIMYSFRLRQRGILK